MSAQLFRYQFEPSVPAAEVEASLILALIATESIHGETATQLGVSHFFDSEKRVCIVNADSAVASDFNALLLGFLRREFSSDAFQVRRVSSADTELAPAA